MPVFAKTQSGLEVGTLITNDADEVTAIACTSQDVVHSVCVKWRRGRRGNVRITNEIVQGQSAASFIRGNQRSEWLAIFTSVTKSGFAYDQSSMQFTGLPSQVRIDCSKIEQFCIWRKEWVPDPADLQVSLDLL